MPHDAYDDNFYINRHNRTFYSAHTVLDKTLVFLPPIHTVMDVGCGVGTWLTCFPDEVVKTGIDGPWVPHQYLKIAEKDFFPCNLEQSIANKKSQLWKLPPVDLLISLEVAEHIEEKFANDFIEFITSHCTYTLFSAAIPDQGGTQHVNEQWPSYWAAKFMEHDFVLYDLIRPSVWDDEKILFWYKQNCFLGARKGLFDAHEARRVIGKKNDIVHPEQFITALGRQNLSSNNSSSTLHVEVSETSSNSFNCDSDNFEENHSTLFFRLKKKILFYLQRIFTKTI